jgi:hypothetical protein
MKAILLILATCLLVSCHGDSGEVPVNVLGVRILVTNGDHTFFVKVIGTDSLNRDSLFVNIVTPDTWGAGTMSENSGAQYLFFTKKSVGSYGNTNQYNTNVLMH